ncbi:MAG: T9SS type A sorting domain-containing protein [Flavobacterium sp.]|nr:T9SS type A sorting domain-containing protein [Flavobacterium sp.]
MKKYYLFLFLISMSFTVGYSQPQLNASNFPSNYSAMVYEGDVTGLSAGNAGANQVWNYASVPTTYNFGVVKVPVESAPFASSFPTSNYCWNYVYSDFSDYIFFKITNNTFENIGSASDQSVGNNYSQNSQNIFTFPYTFNTVVTDTYQDIGDPLINSNTTQYDAYGTIITPFGTFNNAIRQRDGDTFIWFNANPFYLIALGDFVSFVYFYQTNPLSTVQTIADNQIVVYPNPTNNILNLKLPNNIAVDKITITDLTGKTVQEQSQDTETVNVENLADGIYVLQATSGNNSFETKFVKQ